MDFGDSKAFRKASSKTGRATYISVSVSPFGVNTVDGLLVLAKAIVILPMCT
jgi:hypothetical protein